MTPRHTPEPSRSPSVSDDDSNDGASPLADGVAEPSGRRFYPAWLKDREWWVNWVLTYKHTDMKDGEPVDGAGASKQPVAPYDDGDATPTHWHAGLSADDHPTTSFEDASTWDGWRLGADLHAPPRVKSDTLDLGIIIPVDGADYLADATDDPEAHRSVLLVDWDDVRNPDTGALHPECARALQACDCYAEISQSGEGIHQFVFGDLPGGLAKFIRHLDDEPFIGDDRPQVEIYGSGRVVAMTGRHVAGTGDDLADAQDAVDDLCWRFGLASNNAPGTPTDPYGRRTDSTTTAETGDGGDGDGDRGDGGGRPSHAEIDRALREATAYDGDDPDEWDIPADASVPYVAALRARERSDELVEVANWELIGYVAALGKDLGKSQREVLADLQAHPTPQYGYDDARARSEVRGVYRKVESGGMAPPSTATLARRGLLPIDYHDPDDDGRSVDVDVTGDADAGGSGDGDGGGDGAVSPYYNAGLAGIARAHDHIRADPYDDDLALAQACLHAREHHPALADGDAAPPYAALVALAYRFDYTDRMADAADGILGRDAYRLARRTFDHLDAADAPDLFTDDDPDPE